MPIDLLCIGHACYDLIFTVDHHPGPDEKARAQDFIGCGGGTAANAAVTAAKLGQRVAFSGYLGDDIYGHEHLEEMHQVGVDTSLVVLGRQPTPVSSIIVKPNGARTIVNFKGETNYLTDKHVDFAALQPRVLLFDGHQPELAVAAAEWARRNNIVTVLDADTVNDGNARLVSLCTYVAASERFAQEHTGAPTPAAGMALLAELAPNVIVTLGERGLIWQQGPETGALSAFPIAAVDTTGAGDTFHGALAAGVAAGLEWNALLRYASAAGALCCTKHGARLGIPTADELATLLAGSPR